MIRVLTCVLVTVLIASALPAQTTRPTSRNTAPTFDETHVTGSVVDKDTGEAIHAFTVTPGYGGVREHVLHHWDQQACADGRLDFVFDRLPERVTGNHYILIRIEADGYAPHVAELAPDEQMIKVDIALRRAHDIRGAVVTPDGKPAAGAVVFRVTKTDRITLQNDAPPPLDESRAPRSACDSEGRFTCRPASGAFRLVVIHDAGYADVSDSAFDPGRPIALRAWGRIEGVVVRGAEPVADADVVLEAEVNFHRDGRPNVTRNSEAKSDAAGRFTFPRVAAGDARVYRRVQITDGIWNGKTAVTSVSVAPGETVEVQVGGRGRPVIGRVNIPGNAAWTAPFGAMLRRRAGNETVDAYQCELAADGSFHFDDVESGTYELHVQFHGPRGNDHHDWPAEAIARANVTVPDLPGGRDDEPLEVGEIEPKPHKFP